VQTRQRHHYVTRDISTGAIVGIAVGVLVGMTVLAIVVTVLWDNR
jgi:hypothetical protein